MTSASQIDTFHLESDSEYDSSLIPPHSWESEESSIDFVPETCFDSATPATSPDRGRLVPEKRVRAVDDVIQPSGFETFAAAFQLHSPVPPRSGDSRSSVPEYLVMVADSVISSSGLEFFDFEINVSSSTAPESADVDRGCLAPEKLDMGVDDVFQSSGAETFDAAIQLHSLAPLKSGYSSVSEYSVAADSVMDSSGPEFFDSEIHRGSSTAPESADLGCLMSPSDLENFEPSSPGELWMPFVLP